MATYSFKSSGKTKDQIDLERLIFTQTPYGIKTPLTQGTKDGIFEMNYSLSEQFADNLKNLLLTNWGEHLGIHDFGANLRPLTTDLSSTENFDSAAIDRIRTAVARWMPYVELDTFSSEIDRSENSNTAVIKLTVTYGIGAIDNIKRSVQIVLYAI